MPNPKVLEILRKYADEQTIVPGDLSQKQRLEDLAHELQMKTRAVLAELEHDIGLLKERGFDREMWNHLVALWRNLEGIYRRFKSDNPHATALDIVDFVRNKHNQAVIDNLIFLAAHHIKSTNVDFTPNKFMVNPETRGLGLLKHLADFADGVLKETTQNVQPTWRPPTTEAPAVQVPPAPAIPEADTKK